MSQLNRWMGGGKISKLVVVITSKETGEHVERWQFDVWNAAMLVKPPTDQIARYKYSANTPRSCPLGKPATKRMLPRSMYP